MKQLTYHQTQQLRASLAGRVVVPTDTDYAELRRVWNAMIDRRPAAIVQCASEEDVVRAVAFGRQHGFELSVRGAGHNIAGSAVSDGGIVIDFAQMKSVRIDAARRLAWVQPGATLADFDGAAQKYGLATPVGINSTTGIAGLTLGGGFGWLTRKYGMTVDNLVSAQIVTADGETLRASATDHADLFWALRGGGGNFGVVTEFEFKLHPVGPEVVAGLIVFPVAQAKRVLQQYRDFAMHAPDELSVWAVMRHAPPLPFLPAQAHGEPVLILAVFYCGDKDGAENAIAPLRNFGSAWAEHIGALPYAQWQQAFDPLLTAGARNYWKSHNFATLPDAALDVLVRSAQRLPSPECEIFIAQMGGAAGRVAADAMAYGHRDARFVVNVHGRWGERAGDQSTIAWAREIFRATAPYASGGAYVNFMTDDEGERVASAYGANHARLSRVKARYDPQNVFHLNQNIKPAVAPSQRAA